MMVLAVSLTACKYETCNSNGGSSGAVNSSTTDQCSVQPPETPEVPPIPQAEMVPLPWESSSHPERKEWSEFIYDLVGGDLATKLLPGSSDIETFCPRYRTLTNDQRINFWGFLVAGVAKYESAWSPTSRYVETSMGTDAITGKQVVSEGLLQMSYQDVQWYKYCEFDWSKDKSLSATNPAKTIFDPKKNLACGLRVLADQVDKKDLIAVSTGVYWSTLSPKNKNTKVSAIATITKEMPGCQ